MGQINAVATVTDAVNRIRREIPQIKDPISPVVADKIRQVAIAEANSLRIPPTLSKSSAGVAAASTRDSIYFDEYCGTKWPRRFPVPPPPPPVVGGSLVRNPLEQVALNPQPLPPGPDDRRDYFSRVNWAALNPQPLPPGPDDFYFSSRLSNVALNPQPLPPRDELRLAVNLRA